MDRKPWSYNTLFLILIFILSVSIHSRFKPFYTYYNFSFGAKALSMGNAFTAVADDLTAVFWNPAGIAEFKYPEIYFNYKKDKMTYNYELQSNQTDIYTEQYTHNFESKLKNINFMSISVPALFWGTKWSFALSYYRMIPYGMEGELITNLSADSESYTGERVSMDFSGESGIDVLGFTAAFYLSDYFSMGITIQQFLNSGTIGYHYLSSTEEYNQTYTEKIEGRNVILGFIFKPWKDVIFGMTYRTRISDKFNSEYTLQQEGSESIQEDSTSSDFILPARLSFGFLLKPFKFMRFSFDYSIIYWSLGSISDYYNQIGDLEFPVREDFTFSQKDNVNYRMGLEINVPYEKIILFLRGGLFSEQQLFVDSDTGVVKITGYSLGLGLDVSSMVKLDFAYMKQKGLWTEAAYFDPESTVSTRYKNNVVSLSLILRFGRTNK